MKIINEKRLISNPISGIRKSFPLSLVCCHGTLAFIQSSDWNTAYLLEHTQTINLIKEERKFALQSAWRNGKHLCPRYKNFMHIQIIGVIPKLVIRL